MLSMRLRKILQVLILAAALAIGVIQPVFNGLSLLALLLAASVFLLQPAATRGLRHPAPSLAG